MPGKFSFIIIFSFGVLDAASENILYNIIASELCIFKTSFLYYHPSFVCALLCHDASFVLTLAFGRQTQAKQWLAPANEEHVRGRLLANSSSRRSPQ